MYNVSFDVHNPNHLCNVRTRASLYLYVDLCWFLFNAPENTNNSLYSHVVSCMSRCNRLTTSAHIDNNFFFLQKVVFVKLPPGRNLCSIKSHAHTLDTRIHFLHQKKRRKSNMVDPIGTVPALDRTCFFCFVFSVCDLRHIHCSSTSTTTTTHKHTHPDS